MILGVAIATPDDIVVTAVEMHQSAPEQMMREPLRGRFETSRAAAVYAVLAHAYCCACPVPAPSAVLHFPVAYHDGAPAFEVQTLVQSWALFAQVRSLLEMQDVSCPAAIGALVVHLPESHRPAESVAWDPSAA